MQNNLPAFIIMGWFLPLFLIAAINMVYYSETKKSEILESLKHAPYIWQGSTMFFEKLPVVFFRFLGSSIVIVASIFLAVIILVEPHSEFSTPVVSLMLLSSLSLQMIALWFLMRLRPKYERGCLNSRFLFVNTALYLSAAPKMFIQIFFPIGVTIHLLIFFKILF